ncbi:MAG: glycosyltransferase family 4 protein [Pseudomonadota bacterium]|nr:glycosyltransferase family 4 protein [Pseudomonadota bacterium]
MPRFARMLQTCYQARGHEVQLWVPRARCFNWVRSGRFAKWGGYVDEYVLFPRWVRGALRAVPADTLFVFCDQALGPWVPLVKDRPHVVHVHDMLALRSALGLVPQNRTSFSGRILQRYIRRGYRQARHFISVSNNTRDELHRFGGVRPSTSEVVYNGLNFPFAPLSETAARAVLDTAGMALPAGGMLLNVGGGQWYKNTEGVIALYARYVSRVSAPSPLWCVGPPPNASIRAAISRIPLPGKVVYFSNLESSTLQALYSTARALLFPSLAEGFGWPIVEALACGCPVLTTDAPPMNEVGGEAADYLPPLTDDLEGWATTGAERLIGMLSRTPQERAARAQQGIAWSARFAMDKAIDSYLAAYRTALEATSKGSMPQRGLNRGAQA